MSVGERLSVGEHECGRERKRENECGRESVGERVSECGRES